MNPAPLCSGQPLVQKLSVQCVLEFILRGQKPPLKLMSVCSSDELMSRSERFANLLYLNDVEIQHRTDGPHGKPFPGHARAFQYILFLEIQSVECDSQQLSQRLREAGINPVQLLGEPPSALAVRNDPLLNHLFENRDHEESVSVGMSLNQTGKPARQLAIRESGGEVFGDFALAKPFEGHLVTHLTDEKILLEGL